MKKWVCLLLVCMVGTFGCSRVTEETTTTASESNYVKIEIEQQQKLSKKNGQDVDPYVIAVIENTGNSTATSLTYSIDIKNNGDVLQTVTGNIAEQNSANLVAGGTALFEYSITAVDSHDKYDELVYEFTWSEVNTQKVSALISL